MPQTPIGAGETSAGRVVAERRGGHQSEEVFTTLVKRAYFGEQGTRQRAGPPALEGCGRLLSVKQFLELCGHVISDDELDGAIGIPLGRMLWQRG